MTVTPEPSHADAPGTSPRSGRLRKSYLRRSLLYSGVHFIFTFGYGEQLRNGPVLFYTVLTAPFSAVERLIQHFGHEVGFGLGVWLFIFNSILYGFAIGYIVHIIARHRLRRSHAGNT